MKRVFARKEWKNTFLSTLLIVALSILLPLSGCAKVETPEVLAERRAEVLRYEKRVNIDTSDICIVRDDGTVETSGFLDMDGVSTASWTDIVQVVSPGGFDVIGLRSDGTVVSSGKGSNTYFELSEWTDVVQLASNSKTVYGLRGDGTVCAASVENDNTYGQLNVGEWRGVIALFNCNYAYIMYGLTSDGKILTTYEEGSAEWTDVVDFSFGRGKVLALRSDGTVYDIDYPEDIASEIAEWEGIIDIVAAGEYGLAAGLRADGTVVFTGTKEEDGTYEEPSFSEIEGWQNVIDIAGANSYLLGLTSDGRVLFAGRNGAAHNSAFNTSDYRDCVAIFAADPSFVALKRDGTLEGYVNVPISDFSPLW